MKIEEQVVNRELAKKLKKAGYKQSESFWWWYQWKENDEWKLGNDDMGYGGKQVWDYISAPTVAELGGKLPIQLDKNKFENLEIHHTEFEWIVAYRIPGKTWSISKYAPTEADARAKMWLYLKEKRLL